jgi:hypothetical protein
MQQLTGGEGIHLCMQKVTREATIINAEGNWIRQLSSMQPFLKEKAFISAADYLL